MAELICKTEVLRRLKAAYDGSVSVHGDNDNLFADGFDYALDIVKDIKVADAVPVIRCKDCSYCRELRRNDPYENRYIEGCMWCMNISEGVMPDGYCSSAKRRENINGN